MRCYKCDENISDAEDYIVCINCQNEFHINCASTDENCPVCESENTLGIISDC